MTPVFAVIAAQIFTADERMRPGKVAGLVLGFSGVVVMVGAGVLGQAHSTLLAEAACLGAAISYALAGIWGRRFARMGLAPLPTAFGQVLTAVVLLTPVTMLADRPWTLPVPDLHVLLALAALAIVSTAFAYILYFRILASSGATNVLLVTFLVPVSAVCFGVLILGEDLLWRQITGFVLIATGLAAIDGRLPARLFRAARSGSSRSA
jgi:drug/metabolite transporter (DMT)-like permease